MDELKTLGNRLKWVREKRGLSQEDVATAAKVSQGTIGNLESGHRQKPRDLLAIARAVKAFPLWLESGKGPWDASAEPANVFETLTPSERGLLEDFRSMTDSDQEELTREIEIRAAKIRRHMTKVLGGLGRAPAPATPPADDPPPAVDPVSKADAKAVFEQLVELSKSGSKKKKPKRHNNSA